MMRCLHSNRARYRHPYGNEQLFHIVERCIECGLRTRAGWVPQAEVRQPEALPVDPWIHGSNPRQSGLF